ncbi:MAG: ABC transporter substrate-binding protein [Tannerellaceae bacterium]|nr:ABC transporter substrate-binding protein [Tannerellaceae bacterium]
MKKLLISFILILLVSVSFSGCKEKKDSGKIRIGITVPLSGNLAFWGDELRRGMQIYTMKENVTDSIQLLFEDNRGIPSDAVTSMRSLIDFYDVQAVVSMLVKLGAPQRDLAEQKKIPLISTYNSSSGFTSGYHFAYQDFATHEWQLPALTDFVYNSLQKRKGVTFCSADDFGKDGQKFFKMNYQKLGGELIDTLLFTPGSTDLRNEITKVMSKNPEFIFLVGQENELITATKQIRERNNDILIVGIGSFESPTVWGAIPVEYQNNLYFVNSFFDKNSDEESESYYNSYINLYQQEPTMPSVYGYSICKYLYVILKETEQKMYHLQLLLIVFK